MNLTRTQLEVQFLKQVGIKIWRNWRKLRKHIIEKEGCCAMCGYTKKLEGHHILPRHLYPQYALVEQNILILCDDCHFHIGHWCNYKKYNPSIKSLAIRSTIARTQNKGEVK